MEHSPFLPPTPEDTFSDAGEKKLGKKKKKSAENLGVFSVEPKTERAEKKATPDSFWTAPEKIEKPAKQTPAAAEVAEAPEAEAPLEHLSETEKQTVQREIAAAHQAEELQGEPEEASEAIASDAVVAFQERLIAGQDAEMALAETLAEMGVEDDVATEPEPEPIEALPEDPTPREFNEQPVVIDQPERPAVEAAPASPPSTNTRSRKTPLAPAATAIGRGTGLYMTNAMAGGGPRAAFRPEYVPVRDELVLRNLPGGIIGYLIGRRRGRLQAEKKLEPVQKKLEKQVDRLEQDITFKERRIRQLARERADTPAAAMFAERRQAVASAIAASETIAPNRRPAAEAMQLHGQQKAPERIGHMLIGAEAVEVARSEKAPAKPEQPKLKIDKNIETLNRAELLSLSEQVTVEGSTLRQIYETHLIGERGLRRLVAEHLRGGDVKKVLRREIVEREIDFERDPIMRDKAAAAVSGSGTAALQTLLRQADASVGSSDEEVAFYKARASYEADQQKVQKKHQRLVDATMVSTILILMAVIVVLFVSRH